MHNRAVGFVSMLGVVGISIVFGMVIGGKLNAPEIALAAPSQNAPLRLAPASTGPGVVSFADIVENAMPAVVSVTSRHLQEDGEEDSGQRQELWRWFFGPEAEPRQQQQPGPGRPSPRFGEGSGFIISEDGYLLTNNHVIAEADKVMVGLQNGQEIEAEVVGTDPSIDLALLKINADDMDLPTLSLGDSGSLRVGEWVIAIGNPLEYEHTVTAGVVSAKERRVQIGGTDSGVVSFIQTDAAINFGNSGGPLLDGNGNVVGINTAIRRANYAEGIGFALPINHARRVIEQLRETGSVKRGYIGITMNRQGVDEAAKGYLGLPDTRGVIVDEVTENGPAAKAGMRKDDVIRTVVGDPVKDNLDLIGKIAQHRPGDKVTVEVFRSGKLVELKATLADRDEGLRAQFGSEDRDGPEVITPQASSGLGVTVETLASEVKERLGLDDGQRGVLVTEVDFDSTAWDKGLRPGMVITGINSDSIRNLSDWVETIENLRSGRSIKVSILDGAGTRSIFLVVPVE